MGKNRQKIYPNNNYLKVNGLNISIEKGGQLNKITATMTITTTTTKHDPAIFCLQKTHFKYIHIASWMEKDKSYKY